MFDVCFYLCDFCPSVISTFLLPTQVSPSVLQNLTFNRTAIYICSPFVRWVNFVSPNYLFFETMYYTGLTALKMPCTVSCQTS